MAAAEEDWKATAEEIRHGRKKSVLTILEERGLVHNVTGPRDEVDKMMIDERVGAYVGIDPTAASLHIGHMLPLMSLFWMFVHGYHTVTLLGGATAKIGDPTDRLTTREYVHRHTRTENMVRMHYQLKKLWVNVEAYGLKYGYKWEWAWKRGLVNNNTWMNKLGIMEVLQVLGPGVRMGPMLAKETVKNKMNKGDGMSFAEFTYPLLQAWDWWHMYNTMGIRMQLGGSDQYGNITAGVDAVKYIAANHPAPDTPKKTTNPPFGITSPLLTTSSGAKFGKSAGNAIWLDHEMTSTFDLYGYFLRTSDVDVERYLKLFTFMPLEDINVLVKEHMENPSQRKAQHKLASEFVELVHGKDEAKSVRIQHELMFQKPRNSPSYASGSVKSEDDPFGVGADALKLPQVNVNNKPKAHLKLPRTFIETQSIAKIAYASGLAASTSEGHRLVIEDAIHIAGPPSGEKKAMNDASLTFVVCKPWKVEETKKYLIEDGLLILRRGKHNVRIIEVVDDEEYESLGLSYPGKDKMDIRRKIAQNSEQKDLEDHKVKENVKEANVVQGTQWSPVADFEESWQDEIEDSSPEQRIERLRRELQAEIDERQRKIDKKNAPKGKFIGHGMPRGPVMGNF